VAWALAASAGVAQQAFDWDHATVLAGGVLLGTAELTMPPQPGMSCPFVPTFDPTVARPVSLAFARIDLRRPEIRFAVTPRAAGWGEPMPSHGDREFPGLVIRTDLQTVPDFAAEQAGAGRRVLLAVNAAPWEPFVPGTEFRHADRLGLLIADGQLVCPPTGGRPSLLLGRDGAAELRVVHDGDDLSGIGVAVTGFAFCLVAGEPCDLGAVLHPRTGYGLSADRRHLFIVVADGRQPRSLGLTVGELGRVLADLGAHDGVNMDGGGSTTLVALDGGERELRLVNRPSGGLRRNGANLAVFLEPSRRQP